MDNENILACSQDEGRICKADTAPAFFRLVMDSAARYLIEKTGVMHYAYVPQYNGLMFGRLNGPKQRFFVTLQRQGPQYILHGKIEASDALVKSTFAVEHFVEKNRKDLAMLLGNLLLEESERIALNSGKKELE